MFVARVIGRIHATIQHPGMGGRKLLVLERLKPDGSSAGGTLIAVDAIGAGAGETVLVLDEGNGARQILGEAGVPIRSLVVGIVDAVECGTD